MVLGGVQFLMSEVTLYKDVPLGWTRPARACANEVGGARQKNRGSTLSGNIVTPSATWGKEFKFALRKAGVLKSSRW